MSQSPIRIVDKVWGKEYWFANSPLYCLKFLEVNYGHWCSLHFHEKKVETFVVVQGSIDVEVDGYMHRMEAGDLSSLTIWPYQQHRFTSLIQDLPAIIVETSTQHFEDDSTRLESSR